MSFFRMCEDGKTTAHPFSSTETAGFGPISTQHIRMYITCTLTFCVHSYRHFHCVTFMTAISLDANRKPVTGRNVLVSIIVCDDRCVLNCSQIIILYRLGFSTIGFAKTTSDDSVDLTRFNVLWFTVSVKGIEISGLSNRFSFGLSGWCLIPTNWLVLTLSVWCHIKFNHATKLWNNSNTLLYFILDVTNTAIILSCIRKKYSLGYPTKIWLYRHYNVIIYSFLTFLTFFVDC